MSNTLVYKILGHLSYSYIVRNIRQLILLNAIFEKKMEIVTRYRKLPAASFSLLAYHKCLYPLVIVLISKQVQIFTR